MTLPLLTRSPSYWWSESSCLYLVIYEVPCLARVKKIAPVLGSERAAGKSVLEDCVKRHCASIPDLHLLAKMMTGYGILY